MKCPVTGLKVKGAGVGDKSEGCLLFNVALVMSTLMNTNINNQYQHEH